MCKRFVLAAAVLAAPSLVQAQSTSPMPDDAGHTVTARNGGNVTVVTQTGQGDRVAISQSGGNTTAVVQHGTGNRVVIHQSGAGGRVTTEQLGDGREVVVTQSESPAGSVTIRQVR